MKLFAAPVQGYTEYFWRNLHHQMYGGIDTYYTPFIRLEKGEIRPKDVREIEVENNQNVHLVPQIIADNPEELQKLIHLIEARGYHEIDVNLGCPFPPIAKKHKGAGILPFPDEVEALLAEMAQHPTIQFSLKMRLGMEDANEWKALMPLLNKANLLHITLHPRIGTQQYKGNVNMDAFKEFATACQHPLIYNGDLCTLDEIHKIENEYPNLEGIMLGRGLLAHPFLSTEYVSNKQWEETEIRTSIRKFHQQLFEHLTNRLKGGDTQILNKIKPYWEYLLPEMDRKSKKAIHKATKMEKYQQAVEDGLRKEFSQCIETETE